MGVRIVFAVIFAVIIYGMVYSMGSEKEDVKPDWEYYLWKEIRHGSEWVKQIFHG